jgi:hypothetical protein
MWWRRMWLDLELFTVISVELLVSNSARVTEKRVIFPSRFLFPCHSVVGAGNSRALLLCVSLSL